MTAVIASLAILLAALAPSVSHALVAFGEEGSFWAEVCSAAGIKLVKLDADKGEPAHDNKDHHKAANAFEHCPFCSNHAGMAGLPPSSVEALPVSSGSSPHPALFYQSPRPLFVWASAQSRAPPVNS